MKKKKNSSTWIKVLPKSWNSNYEIAPSEHKRKHLGHSNSGNPNVRQVRALPQPGKQSTGLRDNLPSMRKYLPMVDLTRNWHAVSIRNWKTKPREAKNPVLKWAKEQSGNQMWCLMPMIPSLRRQRQEDPKFKAIWTLRWVPDTPESLSETASKTKGEAQNRAWTKDPIACLPEKVQGLGLDPLHHKKKKSTQTIFKIQTEPTNKWNTLHFTNHWKNKKGNEILSHPNSNGYHPKGGGGTGKRLGSGLGREWQILSRIWRNGVHIQVMRLIQALWKTLWKFLKKYIYK